MSQPKPKPSTTGGGIFWFDTYKNHFLYCSIYVAVIATCYQNVSVARFTLSVTTLSDIAWSMLGFIIVCCLYYELVYIWMRRNLPPGDSGLPVFGHLYHLINSPYNWGDSYMAKYGHMCTFNLMMVPTVLIVDEDDVTWALKEERKGHLVPDLVPFVMDLVGRETVMLESGQTHKQLRKLFEPIFTPAAVKSYVDLIDRTTVSTLHRWSSSGNFQTSNEWAKLAMRLFFVCALGEDAVDEQLFTSLNKWFETWEVGFSAMLPFKMPGTALWTGHQGKAGLDKVLMQIIDDFRTRNPPGSAGAAAQAGSMLGRLCYDDDALTDSQIAANIRFIVFAGHDTTKGSFCAFAHFLLNELDPTLRSKLIEEVSSFREPLDPDELKSAPILNAFLAETWRLAPPLDSHNILATKNLDHPDGWTIPKGTRVSIELQLWSIKDPENYPDPTKFRIERWIPESHPLHDPKYYRAGVDYNVMNVKYRSFHMGAHMCLGGHFAKLEARVVLTRLLQKYNIELQNESLKHFPLRQYVNEFKLTPRDKEE